MDLVPEFPGVRVITGNQEFVDLRDGAIPTKRNRKLGRLLFGIAFLLVLFLVQVRGLVERTRLEVELIQGTSSIIYPEGTTPGPVSMKKRYTVLVLGKESENRADTIIMCHFLVDKKQVKVLSFPRDTRVPILRDGKMTMDKLSHTYRWGGLPMLVKSLSKFYPVKIDHIVTIDLTLFRKIIDTIGGVELDVEMDLQYEDKSAGLVIDIKKGKQLLNGRDAEGYVRYRSDGKGDVGRIKRQQKFIKAFIHRTQGLKYFRWSNIKVLGRLPAFIMNLYKDIDTDMSSDLFFKFMVGYSKIKRQDIQYQMLPGQGEYIYDFLKKKKVNYYISTESQIKESVFWFKSPTNPGSSSILAPGTVKVNHTAKTGQGSR